MKCVVVGAGGWGTTLALLLVERGHDVTLYARSAERAHEIERTRLNDTYLPGIPIPTALAITSLVERVKGAELYVFAVPTQATRAVALELAPWISNSSKSSTLPLYVSASKGIEKGTLSRVTEVLRDVLRCDSSQLLALSGPSHAEEVARKLPTAVVVAAEDHARAREVQDAFVLPFFRVYSSSDVVGVELSGALKNVIAVCAGIIDGAGFGDNTKAALITRGLAEIRRLGIALGADEHTFSGLAGLGDLVVTCASRHSRNRAVGEAIGRGRSLAEVVQEMRMVAEGVATTESARALASTHRIEMPIVEETYRVLFEGKPAVDATNALMTRVPRHERW